MPAHEPLGQDCLVVIYTRGGRGPLGKRVPLDGPLDVITIGRNQDNTVVLDFDSVSRRHSRMERRDGQWWMVDSHSTNGTYVNDASVREAPLRNGDRIKLGDVILKYLSGADLEAEFMSTVTQLMVTDGLTQTHNKRYFLEQLDASFHRAAPYGRPLGLLLVDVDRMGKLSDAYGYPGVDALLVALGRVLRSWAPGDATVARWAGGKFSVLLPDTSAERLAADVAALHERIRALDPFERGAAPRRCCWPANSTPLRPTRARRRPRCAGFTNSSTTPARCSRPER